MQTHQAEAIVFCRYQDSFRYLILKRRPEDGGFWQPVTGGVEEGESVLEAALREVREETGLTPLGEAIDLAYSFEFTNSKDETLIEQVYAVEVSATESVVLSHEHTEYAWLPYGAALERMKWENNRQGLRILHARLIGLPAERPSTMPEKAERVFEGDIFDVYQWPQELYDGSSKTFEKLRRPDTAVVIPITADGQILILNEEQPGKAAALQFPGGRIEEGESPLQGVERELLEETGYSVGDLTLLTTAQPVSKIDWNVYLFLARGCTKTGELSLDPGERIEVNTVSFDDVVDMVKSDTLRDPEVITIVLRALLDPSLLAALRETWLAPISNPS